MTNILKWKWSTYGAKRIPWISVLLKYYATYMYQVNRWKIIFSCMYACKCILRYPHVIHKYRHLCVVLTCAIKMLFLKHSNYKGKEKYLYWPTTHVLSSTSKYSESLPKRILFFALNNLHDLSVTKCSFICQCARGVVLLQCLLGRALSLISIQHPDLVSSETVG